jgi:hypothetical protein
VIRESHERDGFLAVEKRMDLEMITAEDLLRDIYQAEAASHSSRG